MSVDVLIVGAGFSGATIARVLADAGRSVLVIDRRPHLGGNAFDELDAHGVLIHRYGPHLFHTNSEAVVAFLSRFTAWRPYEHRVLALYNGQHFPIPVNRTTLAQFFSEAVPDAAAAERILARERVSCAHPRTSEDVGLAGVGPRLFNAFFAPYTLKQWGRPACDLDTTVIARIPVRSDDDDRYFSDRFQCMPRDGYTPLFAAMLDHPNIRVELATAYEPAQRARYRHLVWSGPLDAFYDQRFGALPYRSLRFEHWHVANSPLLQPVAVINHPNSTTPFTRVTEFRHCTGQAHTGTSLVREFAGEGNDPYYPIPAPESRTLADQYRALANAEPDVTFVGRLAQYRYFNMDQAVAAALTRAAHVLERLACV